MRYTAAMKLFRRAHTVVSSTARIEAYSDAVLAIIITILVLEIRPPELADTSLAGVWRGLREVLPHIGAFAFSFLTLSVFWVNHHHFFHELDRSDARLLWLNNALLFFLALVPFTTAFLGHYPSAPGVVMTYCFVLFLAALSFTLMARHALCGDAIIAHEVSHEDRRASHRHNWVGTVLYGVATAAAPWAIGVSYALMLLVPLYYITPRLLHDHAHAR